MKIIAEVQTIEGIRSYRLTMPDSARITWQGINPTKMPDHSAGAVLRAYIGKVQIIAVPNVQTWRRDDITVEEFVQPRGVVGMAWLDKGDDPLFEDHKDMEPIPVQQPRGDDDGMEISYSPSGMAQIGGPRRKRRIR